MNNSIIHWKKCKFEFRDMKRLILQQLCKWKDSSERKPLILNGARQVGKTYILNEFGKAYYKNVAYINLDKDKQAASIWEKILTSTA